MGDSCPGRSAARRPSRRVRCRAGAPVTCDSKKPGSRFCEAALRKCYALHRARDTIAAGNDENQKGIQLNRMTNPASIKPQPMNSIIGQLGRGL